MQTARAGETELVLVSGGVASTRPDGSRTPLLPEIEERIAAARERPMTGEIVLGEPADLAGLLERVVLPVLRAMLEPGESIDGVSLTWEGDPPSRGASDLLLSVVIETETFRWIALTQGAARDDDARSRARLASDLQDFIAESRFARGQLRSHPF